MPRAADHFRSSDVTCWGIVALVCGALAVLSANLSALVPQSVFAALHATRLEGGTINQLRAEIAGLQAANALLSRDSHALATRFTLAEKTTSDMARRLGAIEVSLPNMLEARAGAVDSADITAGIGMSPPATLPAEGGSVTVQQMPMPDVIPPGAVEQPMPPAIIGDADATPAAATDADPTGVGVALGPPVSPEIAGAAWSALNAKVGPLLLGMRPLLAEIQPGAGTRIVAGPIGDAFAAQTLCGKMSRVGIACALTRFEGIPLPE